MKEQTNSKILNSLIVIGITLTLIALVATPLVLTAMLKVSKTQLSIAYSSMAFVLSFCIYACAVPYVIALFNLKTIYKLLTGENAFSPIVAQKFKTISTCAFAEAIIFIVANLFLFLVYDFYLYALTVIPLIIVPFVSITLGFLFLVMSTIFKKSVEIKEENDLTF